MGRKRQWPSPRVPERNRQFARHLNRLLAEASLDPAGLAALFAPRDAVNLARPRATSSTSCSCSARFDAIATDI